MKNLIGQTALVAKMNTHITGGRLGHAYAFTGPAGIGKRTFALSFARRILCSECENEPCGCIACRTFREGTNPDFYEVSTNKPSIGVDVIRDMLEDMSAKPTYGNRKVYFIDQAEIMTIQAQNCLLKTLEEPQSHAVVLLSSTSYEVFLPTIRSRVVNFRMNPYSDEEMKQILCPLYELSRGEMEFIFRFSRGIPGNAIHIIEEGMVREIRTLVFKLLEQPGNYSYEDKIRQLLSENKSELSTVLDILLSVYRDGLMVRQGMENRLINLDKKDMIKKVALLYSDRRLMDKITALEKIRQSFKQNINFQLGLEVLLLEVQEA